MLTYRPEIDGLRAIAVLSVIIYHLQIFLFNNQILAGGYLGVDIFFVISGYLIASLLLKEIKLNNKIAFLSFYLRRIRRLLPVLFVVIILTFAISWFILLPSELKDLAQSIYYSLTFRANHYFHYSGQSYGADLGDVRPFLHNWSLSVEEQFYLIFPIVFYILIRLFKRKIIYFVILGIIISFGMAEWASKYHPNFAFYMLPSRGWELLFGILLAILEKKNYDNKFFLFIKTKSYLFTLIGIFLIIFSILIINNNYRNPSIYTLPSVLGTSLVIYFIKESMWIYKILSSKIFVLVGLISYSLYLWHYPIIALMRIFEHNTSKEFNKFIIIIIIFLFSMLSYKIIEKPFRNKLLISDKSLIITISIFFIFFISTTLLFKKYYNYKDALEKNFKIEKIYLDNDYYYNQMDENKQINTFLKFNNLNLENIIVVGNSYALDTFNMFNQNLNLFENKEFVYWGTQIKCLSMLNFNNNQILVGAKKPHKSIEKFIYSIKNETSCGNKSNLKLSKREIENFNHADTIFISSKYYDEDLYTLNLTLKQLSKTNKKIVLFHNAPEFSVYGSLTILDRFLLTNKKMPNKKEIASLQKKYYERYIKNLSMSIFNVKSAQEINKELVKLTSKYDFQTINQSKYACHKKKRKCDLITDLNEKIYWDAGHTTLEGAKFLGKKLYELGLLNSMKK